MDVGYIKFLKPMYDKFVARSINLLSDDNIKEIDKNLDALLEFTLIKDLIENKFGNPDKETITNIKDIIIKLIPNLQLIGIDIKKGLGEPLTERLARTILKDKKKEDIIKSINRIEALLYAISCTNQSKPSIREVKNELKKLREYL